MKNSLKACLFAAVAFAALCTGCADTKDESSVPEVTTTAATTTEATTTAATTTTVTEASTTVSTEEEVEPDTEASDNDNTPAPGTTQDKPEIEEPQPEVNTTPDGKYTLADTDLVNTDGTYTVDPSGITEDNKTDMLPSTIDWDSERFDWFVEGIDPNPSKIPYSEITLENAAEAFPFLGYIGYKPNYTMVLPTDDNMTIASKIRDNLMGLEPSSGYDLWQYYNFTSEADYKQYLADKEAAGQARDEEFAANAADDDYTMIGDGLTEEDLNNLWEIMQSRSEEYNQ